MASAGIRGLFLVTFDNIAGPKLTAEAPLGCISSESFDTISEYVITQPSLCGKVVTVLHPALCAEATPSVPVPIAAPIKVMSCPIGLSHEVRLRVKILFYTLHVPTSSLQRYPRNQLLCSVGLLLEPDEDLRPFEAVLRKLAAYLQAMEAERGVLSQPGPKVRLQALLPAILHGLNTRGECFLRVGAGDTVALKLFPVLPPPPPVEDHEVPFPMRNLDLLVGNSEDSGLDYAMRVILPHIDGLSFVRAIAERSNVDISLVRRCCQHLCYYGCLALVDVFQYSNVYATLPRVQLLCTSGVLRDSALDFVTKGDSSGDVLDLGLLFRIYAAFGAGTSIGDIAISADTDALGIDDRRLAVFGLLHGLLRRVHRYPTPLLDGGGVPASCHEGKTGADPKAGEEDAGRIVDGREPGRALQHTTVLQSTVAPRSWSGASGDAADVPVDSSAAAMTNPTLPLLTTPVLCMIDGSRHLEELCCLLCCSCEALEAAIAVHGGFTYVLR